MKINWKVRFNNKIFLLSLWALLVVLFQQVAAIWNVDITIYTEQVTDIIETVLTILGFIGVIHDPTTDGLSDSERVLNRK